MDLKESLIQDLRAIANLLEERSFDLTDCNVLGFRIYIYAKTKEAFKVNARALGSFNKSASDWINATRVVSNIASIQVTAERNLVCEKIVTGTRIIPAKEEEIIPEQIIPASPETVEEIFEYVCPESFINTK